MVPDAVCQCSPCPIHHRQLILVTVALLLLVVAPLTAQQIPTGYQEYFVIGHEQHVWDMMYNVAVGEGSTSFDQSPTFINGISSVVTVTASADNQVVYYDHWEDGFEADLLNPSQATTLIIGDGDSSNGRACDFNLTTCTGIDPDDDLLYRGSFVNFNSDQGLPGVTPNPDPGGACQAGMPPPPADRHCSVPVNPRNPADIRFDGGDRLMSSGGPISVAHPQDPLSPYIGGATEIISYQAVANAQSYSVPIGEDIYMGNGSVTEPFKYVYVDLVAFEDGTGVLINSPGAGTVSLTLDQGQHYSSIGFIDSTAAPSLTINAGTKISTTEPLAGLIFTGGDGTFATRMNTLLPDLLHSTDYVLTAPGDDPAQQGSRPLNIYIFNPDPINTLTVTSTDSAGSFTTMIPASSMVDYFTAGGRYVPAGSTVRLTSNRSFWGVSAYDHQSPSNDWGHSWLAKAFLSESYTVLFSPGVSNPVWESQAAQRLANDPDCTIPPAGPGICDTLNRSPVFIAATEDRTQVRIDFDNDGVYDVVDIDGDDCPDDGILPLGCNPVVGCSIPANPCYIYEIDALESLRVYDHTDYDNTGTQVKANKPVAMAYGQDTDQATGPDPIQDTGYVVYPSRQAFLDPVLTIDKDADVTYVPTSGGTVTYSLTVRSYSFSPLTSLAVYDLLPVGIAGTGYVAGSTLVTYPNLVQDTTDPVASTDPISGRDRLDWSLSPDTMGANETLTISYSIAIPAGPRGQLTNTGHASANLGGSTFSPLDSFDLVRTDVLITKQVSHDGTPEPGDLLTYTIDIENNGLADETNAVIVDPIPANTVFSAGSIVDDGPFIGSYDPAQNAVVWTAATFAAGTGPFTLEFEVVINPGVSAGTEVANVAGYESDQTPYIKSNQVVTTSGAALAYSKSGPALLHPNETVTFEIAVENTGTGTATNVRVVDQLPINATYLVESMAWSLNSGAFVTVTDAADSDEGTLYIDRIELLVTSLGSGQDIVFRFQARVDPGTAGLFVYNQANISSTEVAPGDTNLLQIPVVGDADVTGHLFIDSNGNGVQDAGEPDLANVDVVVTDSQSNTQTVSTDGNGDYLVTVEAGLTTADVDVSDPDFPAGASLTTANDPQVVTAVSGATVATGEVGYRLPPLSFSKVSDAVGGEVLEGQTLTYSMTITNNTGVTQTGVQVTDAVPAGTTYVAGSSQVIVPGPSKLRVSEYYLSAGDFSGTSYDLTLDQALATDYFVIIQGSDGNGGNANSDRRGPDESYAALVDDPFGTGDLGSSGAADVITISRTNSVNDWIGVVTVVECLSDCTTDGFQLLDVQMIAQTGSTTGTDTSGTSWSDIDQVLLMGGFNGAGCRTTDTLFRHHRSCWSRFWPTGTDTISWSRSVNRNATSTVMVVEWGSQWTVQRVRVQGNNGGNGANATGEYNTAAISPVSRDLTWIWGTGFTNDNGNGDGAEGVLVTLGDGVNQNATESLVAAGIEYAFNAVDFDVYTMTHADIAVDYRFKADGDDGVLVRDVTVDSAGSERFALSYNGLGSTSAGDYPSALFSARYLSDSSVRLERRFSDHAFPAWIQGIDLSGIRDLTVSPGNPPSGLVVAGDGYTVPPNQSLDISFQVTVDNPVATGLTEIVNSATAATVEQPGPFNASVTDEIVKVAVDVEYDNAGYGVAGESVTYSHDICNIGSHDDSFDITISSELGWIVELIDPGTGVTLATDSNGDGVWDGGVVINTGSLEPLAKVCCVAYDLRVTVPAGTPAGTEETTDLIATSTRSPSVQSLATDETLVLDAADKGPVILLPDNSGVVSAGGWTVYSHQVVNNTGVSDTFDLTAYSEQGWTTTIYYDSNGDGVYTEGVDIAITNTLQLGDGDRQLIFVVTVAPPAAPDGTTDVVHVTATSRIDPDLLDGATDTTTVAQPSWFDISGGGTLYIDAGEVAVYPGTLRNLGDTAETFDLQLSAAWFYGVDGLNHPSELWIDTDSDGAPDTLIATDTDGDGTWDSIAPGYDTNSDGEPDVTVAAGAALAYALRRAVDPTQGPERDPVTLSAVPQSAAGERDSVTATNLLAAATHVVMVDLHAYTWQGQVMVEWLTASETGTVGFELQRQRADRTYEPVTSSLIPGLLNAPQGGRYRVIDPVARPGSELTYRLYEHDVWGNRRLLGRFEVTVEPASSQLSMPAALLTTGIDRQPHSSTVRAAPLPSTTEELMVSGKVKLKVSERGLVFVTADELAAAFGVSPAEVGSWISDGSISIDSDYDLQIPLQSDQIFADGFESGDTSAWGSAGDSSEPPDLGVAWLPAANSDGIYFYAEEIDSIYTDEKVYWLIHASGQTMPRRGGTAPTPVTGGSFAEALRFEQDLWPVTAVITDPEADFWFWDYLFAGGDPADDRRTFRVDVPAVATTGQSAVIAVDLQGAYDGEAILDHRVQVRLNGTGIGEDQWPANQARRMELVVNQSLLVEGQNEIEVLSYLVDGATHDSIFVDAIEVHYQRRLQAEDDILEVPPGAAAVVTVTGFSEPGIMVFELTDPRQPRLVTATLIDQEGSSFRVSFEAESDARYLTTTLARAGRPVAVTADQSSDLRAESNRADYLAIAGPGLAEAAAELAGLHEANGLTTMVVRIEDVYDEMSNGVASPWAIRDLLAHAAGTWALPPRFVVLVGDGSLDYKGVYGAGDSLIPAPMKSTLHGLVMSDTLLADLTGSDGVPELAIGRLPVQTSSEVSAYAGKLASFISSDPAWKSRTLWLADDPDAGGEFVDESESLIALAADAYTAERIYLTELELDTARAFLADELRDGAMMVSFLGHGGLDRLADGGLLTTADVAGLANAPHAPIVTALTCSVGRFDLPGYDTLSEALILQPDGGAIAVWSATSLMMNVDSRALGQKLFGIALDGNRHTLGEAVVESVRRYVDGPDPDETAPYLYTLLGDPAVLIGE